jgi:hypothetical protein
VIYSQPATAEQAARLEKSPRYRQQRTRNASPQSLSTIAMDAGLGHSGDAPKPRDLHRDWSESMNSGATAGAGNYPAKFSFSSTAANCAGAAQPDFVVYGTGLTGSSSQASIVAYDNLYSGCTGTVPTTYWSYNTAAGTVTTSPVFSLDGSQVAFVQTDPLGEGVLVILRWSASAGGSVSSPVTLARVANSAYPGCTAPCMTTEFLANGSGVNDADTNSSAFYDYLTDTAYVGDAAGWLHQITPVFNGVPAEVRSGGWPVQVNSTSPTALSDPVFDDTSGFVFVADTGGYLYRVGPNSAFVVASGQLDFSSAEGGPGVVQGPVVDGTSETVYVFTASDGTGACALGADCAAVYHLPTSFPPGGTGTEAVVGNSTVSGGAPNPLYIGGFDSAYLKSINATGNLYVCGNTGGAPTVYQVSIQNGTLGAVNAGPTLTTATPPCSPVSTVLNGNNSGGATSWIFVSAKSAGASTACAGSGCVFNFKNTPWRASSSYTAGQEVLDSSFHIEVVKSAGTSGSATPFWSSSVGATTTDGTVIWLNQGQASAITPAAWKAGHHYNRGSEILDGTNTIQLATTAGNSGATTPTFNSTPGGTTADGTVVWTNLGAIATSALPAAGGTSGMIFDNTVGAGTLAGTSQAYFSTLSNQTCSTSGGAGGCAVQASQSALK